MPRREDAEMLLATHDCQKTIKKETKNRRAEQSLWRIQQRTQDFEKGGGGRNFKKYEKNKAQN